jgi:succinate dehydrogenase / fumarate reductase, cytochrome b subunit
MSANSKTVAQPALTAPPPSHFLWGRLGSLLSIVPLGIWVLIHLWNNLAALGGATRWEHSVTSYVHPLAFGLITIVVVFLPLLLHTLWGIQRLFSSRPNNVRYGYFGNLRYLLQRIAAVGLLLFIGAHVWLALIRPRLLQGHPETFLDISHEMRFDSATLIVYVLGTLAVCYHLANGLYSFAWTWGLTSGSRSLKRVERLALVAFLVLLTMAWTAVYAIYRAGGHPS